MMEKQDLRVPKTLNSIRQAFFILLEQKGFVEISVQDILDAALINRTTFYKHYLNKNALVVQLNAEILLLFKEVVQRRFHVTPQIFAHTVAPLLLQHRREILLLWKINQPRLNLYQDMQDVMKQSYLEFACKRFNKTAQQLDFQSTDFASMGMTTLRYFVENNVAPDAEKLVSDWRDILNVALSIS
ncbi:MAG: TetR/AcrR family transcriptional regulator [Pasteurellaceae bacterium]|nr:TetR/AcrR family transcriptional regulator [Pasteurellaceae bacterium]